MFVVIDTFRKIPGATLYHSVSLFSVDVHVKSLVTL